MKRSSKKHKHASPHKVTPLISGDAPSGPAAILGAWTERRFLAEERALRRRVGVLRGRSVDAIDLQNLLAPVGPTAIYQAAAVFARTVADHEPVIVLARAATVDSNVGTRPAQGSTPALACIALARSKEGFGWAIVLRADGWARGSRVFSLFEATEILDQQPDFLDPDFLIDPEIENLLAGIGFPGAKRAAPPVPTALSLITASEPACAPIIAPAPPPRAELKAFDFPFDLPWEAACDGTSELWDVRCDELGAEPKAIVGVEPPPRLFERSLDELIRYGCTVPAQTAYLALRIRKSKRWVEEARAITGSKTLPRVTRSYALAMAAARARATNDAAHAIAFSKAFVSDMYDAVQEDGGMLAYLEKAYPSDPLPEDRIGTVAIANLATAAFWAMAQSRPETPHLDALEASRELFAQALAVARRARDLLLDRAGAPEGDAGARLVALTRTVLGSVPDEHGEPRSERFRSRLHEHNDAYVPANIFRLYALWHAVVLHTTSLLFELDFDMMMAIAKQDLSVWQPQAASVTGVLDRGRTAIARHLTIRAAAEPESPVRLVWLARAVAIAPGEARVQSCFNQARFLAGAWSAALLLDLQREGAKSLAASAEALTVAESLGDRGAARLARRRLLELSPGTTHAWAARVRVAMGRQGKKDDRTLIDELLASIPPPPPIVDDRVARALYGAEPSVSLREWQGTLETTRDALAWSELVDEARVEARLPIAVTTGALDWPLRPANDAVFRARQALMTLASRAAGRSRAIRERLSAHAERAQPLATTSSASVVAPWLDSLSHPLSGLGRAVALSLESADRGWEDAMDRAERALDEALSGAWLMAFQDRVGAVLAGTGKGDLPARAAALLAEAGSSAPELRPALEERLTALLEERSQDTHDDDGEEPAAATSSDSADGFRAMRVDDGAVVRSRRDLGTPEWALAEGLRQVLYYNLAFGRRDKKMLRGTRERDGALWELRHRDGRHPVRVIYVLGKAGPRVVAVMVKDDNVEQERLIERVRGWS